MDLSQINEKILQLSEELTVAIAQLQLAEYAYEKRYSQLLVTSKMGNQQTRDAEAIGILDQEGLYLPYLEKKTDVKTLYIQKDCLLEYSANLRALSFNKNEK